MEVTATTSLYDVYTTTTATPMKSEQLFSYTSHSYLTSTMASLSTFPGTRMSGYLLRTLNASVTMHPSIQATTHATTGQGFVAHGDAPETSTGTLIRSLWLYVAPILFIIGLTGNTFTVAVTRRKRLRKTPVSVFLSAMACIDNLVLLTGIVPEWLTVGFGYEIRDEHAQACKWSKFLAYTTGDAAIWILVAFTVDRFGAICFPLRKNAHLRVPGAVRVCALLCVAAACKNVHVFWTRGPIYDEVTGLLTAMCKRPAKYVYFEKYVRPWIAFATVSVIPFVAITVANASIIHTLSKVKIRRASEPSTCNSHLIHTAVLCLSASFTFLICIAPSIVLLIGKPYWTPSNGDRNGVYDVSKAVCNLLVYVNHSINFFLYCLTGGRFRQEFRIAVISWATCGRRPEKGSAYSMGRSSLASMSQVTRGGAIRIHKDCVTTDSNTPDGGYNGCTPRGTLTKFNPTAV